MSKSRSEVLAESKSKGVIAGAATVAAVGIGAIGFPFIAAGAAIPAAIFTYRWWKHRAENGIKF